MAYNLPVTLAPPRPTYTLEQLQRKYPLDTEVISMQNVEGEEFEISKCARGQVIGYDVTQQTIQVRFSDDVTVFLASENSVLLPAHLSTDEFYAVDDEC